MIYIYDILLNFNNDFYEFYEWEKGDSIYHVKRIPIFKVDTKLIEEILTKKIKIDDPIVTTMLNKTEIFESKKIKTLKYAALLTDSYRVIGILLDDNFKVSKVSDLLLDEALDAIEISERGVLKEITYNIIGSKKENNFLTRNETRIKKCILAEIKNAYKEKDNLKLEYLYFEFFDKISSNIDEIYEKLMNSLSNEISEKHIKLYGLIRLANGKNKLSNLTN